MCLASVFDMLSMRVFTTRHWRMSARFVQELNVCTVYSHGEWPNPSYELMGRQIENITSDTMCNGLRSQVFLTCQIAAEMSI